MGPRLLASAGSVWPCRTDSRVSRTPTAQAVARRPDHAVPGDAPARLTPRGAAATRRRGPEFPRPRRQRRKKPARGRRRRGHAANPVPPERTSLPSMGRHAPPCRFRTLASAQVRLRPGALYDADGWVPASYARPVRLRPGPCRTDSRVSRTPHPVCPGLPIRPEPERFEPRSAPQRIPPNMHALETRRVAPFAQDSACGLGIVLRQRPCHVAPRPLVPRI